MSRAANPSTMTRNRRSAGSRRRSEPATRRWVLNVRLLLASLGALAIGVPALYFWNQYQVLRNAGALLDMAERQEQQEEFSDAARTLFQYLRLRPADSDARIRVAKVWHKQAVTLPQKQRAVQLHARAISLISDDQAEEKTELRRQHMSLVLETGDPQEALGLAEKLLVEKRGPETEAEALRVKALALFDLWRNRATGKVDAAADALERAFEADPSQVAVAASLAQIWRDELRSPDASRRGQRADEIMNEMVKANASDAAYLARHRYRRQYELPGADDDLERALAADAEGKNADLILFAAARELDQESWAAAQEHFQRLIEIAPKESRAYLGLGLACLRQKQAERAIEVWKEGIANAGDPQLLIADRVVRAFADQRRWKEAGKSLKDYHARIESLAPAELPAARQRLDLLEAEVEQMQGNFAAAVPLWQRVVAQEASGAQSKLKAERVAVYWLRLGQCFEQLGEYDQAAAAFQEAADRSLDQAERQFAAGIAWVNAGIYDQALRMFHLGLDLDRSAKAPWASYLQAILRQQLNKSRKDRDWKEFDTALATAKQSLPNDVMLRILEADYQAARGGTAAAVSLLKDAEDGATSNPGLLQRFVLSYERWGATAEADRLAAELHKQQPTELATVLMDANLSYARGEYQVGRRQLQAALADLSDSDRHTALAHLARLDMGYSNLPEARETLVEITKDEQVSRDLLQARIELDLATGDKLDADQMIERLKARRGDTGTFWRYYRAQRLLQDAAESRDQTGLLAEAESLRSEIERIRPNWSAAKLLKARLLMLKQDDENAIKALRRAIDLGERRPQVYEELINLLGRKGRLSEADHYLDHLRDNDTISSNVAAMAMAIDVRQGNVRRAIELARRECQRNPDAASGHLHLGRLLTVDREGDKAASDQRVNEAEAELKRARELAPEDMAVWSSLVQFYLQSQRGDDARSLLADFVKIEAADTPEGSLLLAQTHAALGDREEAENHFSKALASAPKNAKVHASAASFFLASDPERAQSLLRQAVDLDPNDAGAVQMLAAVVAARGGNDEDLKEVSQLLQSVEVDEAAQVNNRRLQAILLLRRGGTKLRREAKQILEYITSQGQGASPLDRLLLARIYEAQGQAILARQQLQTLAKAEKPRPEHLATYLEFLLRQHDKSAARGEIEAEANKLLHSLAGLEPEEMHFRTASLRVRWLKALHEDDRAAAVIEDYRRANLSRAEGTAQQAQVKLAAANLYAAVDMPSQAERDFRDAYSLDVATFPAFATWLGREGRAHEAVELCVRQSSNEQELLRVAKVLVAVLMQGDPSDEDRQRADAVIQQAMARHGGDVSLLCTVSSLRLVNGDEAEAIRLLERALEIDPRNLHALNNLAVLLSEKPSSRQRALEYANRAIAIGGLSPQLADTKGWALLMQGNEKEAESLFDEAIAADPSHKRYYFHLAVTKHAMGDLESARKSLQQANVEKLTGEILTREERTRLDNLRAAR